jgi:hypothetical protein
LFAQRTAEPDGGYFVLSEEYCDILDKADGQVIASLAIVGIKKVARNGCNVTVTVAEEKQRSKTRTWDVRFKNDEIASLVHNVLLTQEALRN